MVAPCELLSREAPDILITLLIVILVITHDYMVRSTAEAIM